MSAGGTLRVGGRVRVRELASRAERAAADRPGRDAAPSTTCWWPTWSGAGVEVTAGGATLRFDRRRTGVRVGLAGGRPVLAAAA